MLMMQFETKAQDRWKFYNSLAVMYGQYDNALLMDKQNGISVHVSGDYLNQAGFRVGVQSTKINFQMFTSPQVLFFHHSQQLLVVILLKFSLSAVKVLSGCRCC